MELSRTVDVGHSVDGTQRTSLHISHRSDQDIQFETWPERLPFSRTALIHSAVCLTTGSQPLPKPVLHTLRSSASSFNLQYPFFSLRSFTRCLILLPRLPVTSILHSIFPSITNRNNQYIVLKPCVRRRLASCLRSHELTT